MSFLLDSDVLRQVLKGSLCPRTLVLPLAPLLTAPSVNGAGVDEPQQRDSSRIA